jgi:hypothetical protein
LTDEIHYTIHRNMVFLLTASTIVLIISRILILSFQFPPIIEATRDVDFTILLRQLKNGLFDFYKTVPLPEGVPDWPPYYLYFWYFIFFPFGLLDPLISMLIWDILRLATTAYVAYKALNMITYRIDLLAFYLFIYLGFLLDAWYNNCNFLLMFFLYLSYTFLEKDKKWASGIFFALSTVKINSILFLPALLIVKKIKLKEVVYYLIPFGILFLPYVIFPDFLLQMLSNWANSTPGIQGITPLDSILWKAVQPSHFLFLSIILMTILEGIIKEKRHKQVRKIIYASIAIFYLYITIVVWIIPLFTEYLSYL